MNGEPLPVWARVVGTIPRLIGLSLFAGAASIGGLALAECTEDWTVIGATAVMAAWTLHWAIRLAIFHRVAEEKAATRVSKLIQAAGYLVAAAGFGGTAFRYGTSYVAWWPFFVAMLFVWGMAVSMRDARTT